MTTASPLPPAAIAARLIERFGQRITPVVHDKHPRVHTDAGDWRDVAAFLKTDPALAFDWLACLSGLDYAVDGRMAVCAELWSTLHGHRFAVKAFMSHEAPEVPSVAPVWPAAGWHEREAYDLFGIRFTGHPDLRRILLADDWVGHPLRKDYEFPRQVHGIPGSVELDWHQNT